MKIPSPAFALCVMAGCSLAPFSPTQRCDVDGAVFFHESTADCSRDAALLTRAVSLLTEHGLATTEEMRDLLDGHEIWVYAGNEVPQPDPAFTLSGLYHAGWPGHPIELAAPQTELSHELIHAIREELRGVSNEDEIVHRGWCWKTNAAGQCLTSDGIRDATGDGEIAIPTVCREFSDFALILPGPP